VAAATPIAIAPTLPVLGLVALALAWPLAPTVAGSGPMAGAAGKGLNPLAILTAEGISPVFEDTGERLGLRIAGVLIGLAFATAVLTLVARAPRATTAPEALGGATPAGRLP